MAKSILICHPGRCGSHWLLNLLKEIIGLQTLPAWPGVAAIPFSCIVGTREQLVDLASVQDNLHVLFLLRDPRDVETSMRIYNEHVTPGCFHVEADAILENLGWFRWYLETAPRIRHAIVRYEWLWADPQSTMQRLLSTLGYSFDEKRLQSTIAAYSFETCTGRERNCEDVTQHNRKGICGDWANHWSCEKTAQFMTKFAGEMTRLGYA